jgi:hypothetical protein
LSIDNRQLFTFSPPDALLLLKQALLSWPVQILLMAGEFRVGSAGWNCRVNLTVSRSSAEACQHLPAWYSTVGPSGPAPGLKAGWAEPMGSKVWYSSVDSSRPVPGLKAGWAEQRDSRDGQVRILPVSRRELWMSLLSGAYLLLGACPFLPPHPLHDAGCPYRECRGQYDARRF